MWSHVGAIVGLDRAFGCAACSGLLGFGVRGIVIYKIGLFVWDETYFGCRCTLS